MSDEKIQKILQVFYSALYIVYSLSLNLLGRFLSGSDTAMVIGLRWKANRERYEAKLANSMGMPGYWRTFSRVHESLGDIFDALLIIVFGSALITTVANSTTGSAAKNGNVTASPGAAAIVQLLPFIFVAIIAFSAFDLLKRRKG